MTNVRFDAGIGILGNVLNSRKDLGYLFSSIAAKQVFDDRHSRKPGHAIVFPSHIDVTLFTDIEDNFGYAINTSIELDSGRMKISDFVIQQAWTKVEGENRLELLNEAGDRLVLLDSSATTLLSLTADSYRLAHKEPFSQ